MSHAVIVTTLTAAEPVKINIEVLIIIIVGFSDSTINYSFLISLRHQYPFCVGHELSPALF